MENWEHISFQCSTIDCARTAQFYCRSHRNSLLCNGCCTFLHSRCLISRLEHNKYLIENIGIIIDKLHEINEYAKIHGLFTTIDNFDILFSKAEEDAKDLKRQATQAIEDEQYWRIGELNLEAKKLK